MEKSKGLKKRAEYLWMYYKTPVFVVLGILLTAAYWIHAAAAEKDCVLSVMLIDSHSATAEEDLSEKFALYEGIDREKEEVAIHTSYLFSDSSSENYALASLSRFYSQIGTRDLDVCGMLAEDFETYAGSDCFLDLRECISAEKLEGMEDILYYRDGKPLGIYTKGLPGMKRVGCYTEEGKEGIVGIIYNTRHVEMAVSYLTYLGRQEVENG